MVIMNSKKWYVINILHIIDIQLNILRTAPVIIYEARLEFEPTILTAETQNSFDLKLCYKFTPR